MSGSGHRYRRSGRTRSHRRVVAKREQLVEQEVDEEAAEDLAELDDVDDPDGAVA